MAKYKKYDYSQDLLIPVSLDEQLIPGTLQFAIHTLVETRTAKVLQMKGVILPLIDSLKVCVDLLVSAGTTLPEGSGIDRALGRIRRVIVAGEKAAEGLCAGLSQTRMGLHRGQR